jgi:cytidylate kinase
MNNKIPIITIDGPSGSGKGTISQLLAQKLDWHFLDSGALYRALAFAAIQNNLEVINEAKLQILAHDLPVDFIVDHQGNKMHIMLNNIDITDQVRSEACGNFTSKIAALAGVRQALLERQRQFQQSPGLVADGRDMGTVVFPHADLKIFLTASAEERAKRRYQQLQAKGINVSLPGLLKELKERDVRDQSRSAAPLKPAADAHIIDTTSLSIEQVLTEVLTKYNLLVAN